MKFLHLILINLAFLSLTACQQDYDDILKERNAYATTDPSEIVLVAIAPSKDQYFANNYIRGVELAIKKVNNDNILLNNKAIKLNIIDSKSPFELMQSEITKVISDPKVVAVLGHTSSSSAIPASIIYGKAGVVFIPSFATAETLGASGRSDHIFKMLPEDTTQIDQIINFTKLLGRKKVALFSSQDKHNKNLSILFSSRAEDQKLSLVEEVFFPENERNFSFFIEKIKKSEFNSIVISCSIEQAVPLVREIRRSGIHTPILFTNSIDKHLFSEAIDKDIRDIITVSSYSMDVKSINDRIFIEAYNNEYEQDPNGASVIGYDSVMLLVHAINKAGSTHIKSISSALHNSPAWSGVKNLYKYGQFGDVKGKKYHFEILRNKEWNKISYSEKSYNRFLISESMDIQERSIFAKASGLQWQDFKYEYNYYLLKIAQKVFRFKNLGVTYIDDDKGKNSVHLRNLERLAEEVGVKLISCNVPSILRKNINLLKEFISVCYKEISILSDAVFFSPSRTLPIDFYNPIIDSLDHNNIPVFSVDTRKEIKPLTVISLNRSEVEMDEYESNEVLPRILLETTIYDYYHYIKYVPEVSVNFNKYKKFNMNEDIVLSLSPVRPILEFKPREIQ